MRFSVCIVYTVHTEAGIRDAFHQSVHFVHWNIAKEFVCFFFSKRLQNRIRSLISIISVWYAKSRWVVVFYAYGWLKHEFHSLSIHNTNINSLCRKCLLVSLTYDPRCGVDWNEKISQEKKKIQEPRNAEKKSENSKKWAKKKITSVTQYTVHSA